jgi:hypothetical protein
MELTDKQFHDFEANYHEKYVDEVQEHGNGGFKSVTNRRTATRHALKLLVADLEPSPEPLVCIPGNLTTGDRIALAVDLKHFDIAKGGKGTVLRLDADDEVVVDFDDGAHPRWMKYHELVKLP